MYEKIKEYYEKGVWNEQRVREAVAKNVITAEEFKAITGKGLLGEEQGQTLWELLTVSHFCCTRSVINGKVSHKVK